MSDILIRDIMIRNVRKINPEEKIALAWLRMLRYGIGALPVVKDDNTLIGMLTMRDIDFAGPDIKNLFVKNLMTKDNLITATETNTLTQVADMMITTGLQRIPVVDDKGKLIGLVTQSVIISSFRALFK